MDVKRAQLGLRLPLAHSSWVNSLLKHCLKGERHPISMTFRRRKRIHRARPCKICRNLKVVVVVDKALRRWPLLRPAQQ
jgi:hypothetical protein